MTKLDDSFAAICAQHGLLNIGITFHTNIEDAPFSVSVQWPDETKSLRRGCVSGHASTIADALSEALHQMIELRGSRAELADEPLTEQV